MAWVAALPAIASFASNLLGSSESGSSSTTGEASGFSVTGGTEKTEGFEQLQIDQAGIDKMVKDLLKDPSIGLANVVGEERGAGLYGSSGAAFATNDLLDKIAGTIAQLTAKKVQSSTKTIDMRTDTLQRQTQASQEFKRKKGLFSKLFSDVRLKTNVMRIGTTPGGLPWYRYEIFGIPDEGVLAQDLLILLPEAVERHESGYFMVDYSKVH